MAIDTAEKRKSVSGILPLFAPGVTPNAAKDQEWRQEAGWGYPGILAGEPSLVGDGTAVLNARVVMTDAAVNVQAIMTNAAINARSRMTDAAINRRVRLYDA